MKTSNLFSMLILVIGLIGCKADKALHEVDLSDAMKDDIAQTEVIVDTHRNLYGIYTGTFNAPEPDYYPDDFDPDQFYKKISLKINRIHHDSVYGHSIVNGHQRPFTGLFNEANQSFILDEPGDDTTDGRFEASLKEDSLKGTWIAYNSAKVKAPKKFLKLQKREFVYNPNFMLSEETNLIDWKNPQEFIEKYTDEETGETEEYPLEKYRSASDAIFQLNASKNKLTEEQLKNLRKLDLEIIKNTIYARHGYSFKKATFRYFFDDTDWYIPAFEEEDIELTDIEKENLEVLLRFIKYAEDKYDYFGR